jgi:hypothetical protein
MEQQQQQKNQKYTKRKDVPFPVPLGMYSIQIVVERFLSSPTTLKNEGKNFAADCPKGMSQQLKTVLQTTFLGVAYLG